ncbi:hypothetical protein QR680_005327 [Steinernema hermaphroditum]|uniref:Uncharacterized protein n=1 Tax=Steinernema hermaphroditum TaxID=289476 RepID=A0AA39HTX7_9BILA|nr:hypothetical protein QR680_005327 [Steinernema hermaphroditum]
MVILKQGPFFLHQGKNKWSEVWMILSHELEGPSVVFYKDSHAKKILEEIRNISTIAEQMRFGTTTIPVGTQPEVAKDVRIHSSCFVAIPVEKTVKKQRQTQTLWLCAPSTTEMFKLIRLLSACLVNIQYPAPAPNTIDDMHALHRYRPSGFEADNEWEIFWDNPSRAGNKELESLKQSGMTMSVDHLNDKRTMKDVKKTAKKGTLKQYQSASALNEIPNKAERGSLLSVGSCDERTPPNQRKRAETFDVLVDEPVPQRKAEELHRTRELGDSPLFVGRRKSKPRSHSTSASTTPQSLRKEKRSTPPPLRVTVPKETCYTTEEELDEPVTPKAPQEPARSRYSTSDYSSQGEMNHKYDLPPPEDTVVHVHHHHHQKREAHYEMPPEDDLPVVIHHHRHMGTPPRKQSTYRTPRESPRVSPKTPQSIRIERRISDLSYAPFRVLPVPKRRLGRYVNAEVQTESVHPPSKVPLIEQRNPALELGDVVDEEELRRSVENLRSVARSSPMPQRDNISVSDWSEAEDRLPVTKAPSPQPSTKSVRSSYSSEYRFCEITERSSEEPRIYEIEITRH